jgi:hypothetical protein
MYNLYLFETYVFLDTVAVALRKATISDIMTVCPSVRPFGFPHKNATPIATMFVRIFFETFAKIRRHIPTTVEIITKLRVAGSLCEWSL